MGIADQPAPRRRFQFRLRRLMIVVTLLATVSAIVNWLVRQLTAGVDRL